MAGRCAWAKGDLMTIYHDNEWGMPQHDDQKLFEFLVLEGAQAGLSWLTILRRREGYRKAFSGFDASKVSRYGSGRVKTLLQDASIIRNRMKIESAINNAGRFLDVRDEFGSFDRYIWKFVNNRPIKNRFASMSKVPSSTPLSEQVSADLKMRGFTFVGPTICYAFMQAVGMVNDHTADCFLHQR